MESSVKRDPAPERQEGSANKQQYEERKALEKKIRKISNRIKALEHEIEEIEAKLARMDALLMNPENITGMQVYEEYEQMKRQHDEALASWEKQTMQLEKTEARRK
jgi:ATP-binding cassette subfamily F protein 3